MNYTLITGASRGIGYELAVQFAKQGHNLVLVSRDESKLNLVSGFLENTYRIKTLIIPCDLSLPGAADDVYEKVLERGFKVDYVVNNAGFYVSGDFSETSWDAEQKLIQLQCIVHTRLIKLFLPEMISRGRGGILNVASTGSFVPVPAPAPKTGDQDGREDRKRSITRYLDHGEIQWNIQTKHFQNHFFRDKVPG